MRRSAGDRACVPTIDRTANQAKTSQVVIALTGGLGMGRRQYIAFGAVVMAALLTIAPLAAHAEIRMDARVSDDAPATVATEDQADWFRDLGSGLGVSPEEAEVRYSWSEAFSESVQGLKRAYPDQFATARMHQTGAVGATVTFVGTPPADAAEYFADVPAPVSFEGGAKYSEIAYLSAVPKAHYAVRAALEKQGLPTSSVASNYDQESGEVQVKLLGKQYGDVSPALLNMLESRASTAVAALSARLNSADLPPTSVIADPEGSAVSDVVRGGGQLSSCTSGFSVIDTNTSVRGVLTADHCGTSQFYEGRNVLSYRRSMTQSRGDISFFQSSETTQASFFYQMANYRFVTQQPLAPIDGQGLCKFGRNTGQSCDNVRNYGGCRGPYCGLIEMYNRKADGGDSGGPWYDGDRAVGVHSGGVCDFGVCHDQFSYLRDQIGPYLSVNLLTN